MPLGLLRRHVGEGADDVPRPREHVLAEQPRDPEVRELGHAVAVGRRLRHDHVLGLDVAVDDPAPVGMREGRAEHRADPHDVAVGQRAVGQQSGEGVTADQLGDEIHGVVVLPAS